MDTGIDGMVIDAVNWYIGCTWELNRRRMTDVITSYGNAYAQPEGAGAFREDPVAWITEGGWNSVQDYGLGIWWEDGTNVIKNAIDTGDPRPLEAALRSYHDRVVAAGGSLYYQPTDFDDAPRSELAFATLATVGSLIQVEYRPDRSLSPEARWLLGVKAKHPALHQRSTRRRLPTRSDDKHYAFLRTPAGGEGERVLVVLNFQKTPQDIAVDLSGVEASTLVDLKTDERLESKSSLRLAIPAYGYRLFTVARRPKDPLRPSQRSGRSGIRFGRGARRNDRPLASKGQQRLQPALAKPEAEPENEPDAERHEDRIAHAQMGEDGAA